MFNSSAQKNSSAQTSLSVWIIAKKQNSSQRLWPLNTKTVHPWVLMKKNSLKVFLTFSHKWGRRMEQCTDTQAGNPGHHKRHKKRGVRTQCMTHVYWNVGFCWWFFVCLCYDCSVLPQDGSTGLMLDWMRKLNCKLKENRHHLCHIWLSLIAASVVLFNSAVLMQSTHLRPPSSLISF